MERIEELKQLYAGYDTAVRKARAAASWSDGLFGFGNDPRKAPCHEAFYHAAKDWAEAFAAQHPDPAIALAAARFMVEAPEQHREKESFMFVFVALGNILPLIPFLEKADCQALAQQLDRLYPRRERMPLQQEVFKKLQKAGKQHPNADWYDPAAVCRKN